MVKTVYTVTIKHSHAVSETVLELSGVVNGANPFISVYDMETGEVTTNFLIYAAPAVGVSSIRAAIRRHIRNNF